MVIAGMVTAARSRPARLYTPRRGYAVGFLVMAAALYVGAYYATVRREALPIFPALVFESEDEFNRRYVRPNYALARLGDFFGPIHEVDRKIRPEYWSYSAGEKHGGKSRIGDRRDFLGYQMTMPPTFDVPPRTRLTRRQALPAPEAPQRHRRHGRRVRRPRAPRVRRRAAARERCASSSPTPSARS